ncbi:MAG: nucleotidyltransferase family protein [Candidatus Eisenbacteria bacterium]|uniref:Nucleotidyltransferase family protein n=1 Tax=Eiseniibacteriota bacterium TaxID=2212470 RepID=A0A9D6LAD2_UNCEI|nr:nucleotidyltransferase family protein [Candidatus Eisenbacteria bacterium]MBI3540510.1 nucleotidyltransferase family protein [Candidatus Eisenbacteria bacterium]
MRAFVLAGGLGTRLKATFGDLPKPLAPVGGRPLLERQLEWLAGHGVRDVVLCVGHGGDRVRDALGDGARLGVSLRYSAEAEPLGTGGALALARRFVDGPALVLNGDTLAPCDPWALERARWETGAIGAVALYRVEEAASRGRVETERGGRIRRFLEKDADHRGPAWVNGGLYAFAARLWRELPASGPCSLERDVLPRLAAAGRLRGFEAPGTFWDIGTPEDWARADREFAS